MAVRFPIVAYTYDQLNADAKPGSSTQPESIPYTFFDQQNYASNWTSVTHFATVQTDPTLGNIQQANTLSAEQYFRLWAITLDWIIAASAFTAAGSAAIVDDLLSITNGARALVNVTIAMKQYVQAPMTCFHSSGGINTSFALGTPATAAIANYAQNWYPDGGFNIGGAIVLPPRQTFTFTVQGVASTLVATRAGRFTLHGVLSRPVR